MCGILLALTHAPIDPVGFDQARDTLLHRGPDAGRSVFLDRNTVGFGHRRLSIIDLSARSDQPMQSGNLTIIFNGEIYNHVELRQELVRLGHVFVTTSDTEVLLHGFKAWGHALCNRLIGMFAFAIWDQEQQSLFLARDHFGQKPLYLADIDGQFIAASEVKAIRKLSGRTFRLRQESVIDALVQDFVPEPNTWYQDISTLPAGHWMTVSRKTGGGFTCTRSEYWTFRPDPDPAPVARGVALERLTDELDAAVRSHLVADVEVGAFLSGGIDSSCIVMLANAMSAQPVKTFSIGFQGGDDELALARDTAARLGTTHFEGIVTEQEFRESAKRALTLFDFPFGDTSLVPTERVSELASRHLKVVLTGDGGDESFGGYDYGRYVSPQPGSYGRIGLSPGGLINAWRGVRDRLAWRVLGANEWALRAREYLVDRRRVSRRREGVLGSNLVRNLSSYDPSTVYRQHRSLALDGFRDAQWVGIKVPLPGRMLAKVDRCSMAHSLETRAPFLSPRLAEFMLDLPRTVTNPDTNAYKGLLREWLNGRISPAVLNAPKRGFDLPKGWESVRRKEQRDARERFPECVAAGLVAAGGWKRLRNAPRALWYFSQIEIALKEGMMQP